MSKLLPINDYFMVEVGDKVANPMGLTGLPSADEGIRQGVVLSISDQMTFFGFNTFMFDSSLMDKKLLEDIYNHYKQYVGKKVYWPERSESGAVIKYNDSEYAFIKMSALMAVEED
jgi:hypothetical protein